MMNWIQQVSPRQSRTWTTSPAPTGKVLSLAAIALICVATGWLSVFHQGAVVVALVIGLTTLIIGVVAVSTHLSRPRFADIFIAACVIYLPIAPFLTPYSIAFSILRFVLAGVIVVGLLLGFIPRRDRPLSRGGLLVVVFALYQLVAFAAEGASSYGFLRLINWVMFIPLVFIRFDSKAVKYVFGSVLFAALVLFAGILLQRAHIFGGVWGGEAIGEHQNLHYTQRYTSFLQNPNDLGLFMLCTGVVAYIYSLQTFAPIRGRIAGIAFSLLAIYSMSLASSRGAFLALPLVLCFLFIMGSRRALLVALALAVIAVGVIGPLIPSVQNSVATTFTSVENVATGNAVSSKARLTVWNQRLSNAGNFVLGTGYGGYAPGAKLNIGRTSERQQLYQQLTVDNGWLKLWLEEGIIGLLIFAGIIIYLLNNSIQLGRNFTSGPIRLMGLMITGITVAMVFRSFSVDLFDISPWNFFIWLIFGLSASFMAMNREGSPAGCSQIGPQLGVCSR
jgi:O-antigen ligase